jgi:hypothetical protein
MPDEFAEDFYHLLTKYCGSKFDYNWDEWAEGKIYLRLTMQFKPKYKQDTDAEE